MKTTIGITGPNGFIASHLSCRLAQQPDTRILECSRDTFADEGKLRKLVSSCDTIVHLAGVNRADDETIYTTNTLLARKLVDAIHQSDTSPHVVFASSTQRDRENAYGRAKLESENILASAAAQFGFPVSVLVLPNVYGPGCRPFYNSVVATFCHQLAHGEQPQIIHDQELEFLGVQDVVDHILQTVASRPEETELVQLRGATRLTVQQLLDTLIQFRDAFFVRNVVPPLADPVQAGLYATFLSYIDLDDHRHTPQVFQDARGMLFEIIKLAGGGQVFFSATRPGVTRGDHFHTRKIEWFCVLRGQAAIRLRRVGTQQLREFRVSGDKPEFISIPALHTHHIENIGDEDLLTMFWCNEIFSPENPDTFQQKVA